MTVIDNPIASQREHGLDPRRQLVHLVVAPIGQLSADGQLRELMQERRERLRETAWIWYFNAADLSNHVPCTHEAVATLDPAVAIWLQLRFGGICREALLPMEWLTAHGQMLPPQAPNAPLDPGSRHGF